MKPFLSVVVVSYNMARELPRTLRSMSADYQRGIGPDDYEVILVDNGSPTPPRREDFAGLDIDLTVYSMPSPTHSPVPAINFGLDRTSGGIIGVCIDGARMLSPGVFATARDLLAAHDRGIVATKGRYLGPKMQKLSMLEGYDAAAEDALLAAIDWENDGYRLFDISVFDESSGGSWFGHSAESNALFAHRSLWAELGGYDPAFTAKGGGLVNLDTWDRACKLEDVRIFSLVGEATFHQIHGGVATNGTHDTIATFYDEYRDIRGRDFAIPQVPVTVHGTPLEAWVAPESARRVRRRRTPVIQRLRSVASRRLGERLGTAQRQVVRRGADIVAAATSRHPVRRWKNLRAESALADGLEVSGLFDAEWYAKVYPDVVRAGYRPAVHYVRYGATQRRQPGPLFDGLWYLATYDDVREQGLNPLLHFIQHGRYEGRRYRGILKS